MSVEVHVLAGRLVVTLGDAPEEPMRDLLARQLRDAAGGGPVVIDLSRITLRPSDVRAVQDLIGRLGDTQVWLSCSRLSGRRVLNRLLERPCAIVRHPEEVPLDLTDGVSLAEGARPASEQPLPA